MCIIVKESVASNGNSPFGGQNFLLKVIEYFMTVGFNRCSLIKAQSDTKSLGFFPILVVTYPYLILNAT